MSGTEAQQDDTKTLEDVTREYIFGLMDKHKGCKRLVSEEAGVALKTIYNMLTRWEIDGHTWDSSGMGSSGTSGGNS